MRKSTNGQLSLIHISSFPFSFRAFRSAPGGKVRSLGAPREPSRAGGLGRGRRGGRSRWRRKNREPVAVVGGGRAKRPGFRGGGLFPRRQRQFRSGPAKKQATKRRTKKDFPSPKRRRFVKTGITRDIRKKVVLAGHAAPKAKDDHRTRLWGATSPRGAAISGGLWLETAAPFRVKVRQIRPPGYPAPKT